MNKELQYMGYSAAPSDYECADGDLSLSLNAVHDDAGGLRPATPANVLFRLPELHTDSDGSLNETCEAVAQHKNTGYNHIICLCTYTDDEGETHRVIKWVNKETDTHDPGNFMIPATTTTEEYTTTDFDLEDAAFLSANTIGNTLVILTDKGLRYFLWRPQEVYYTYLGNHLPECPMSFGLQGELKIYKYPYGYSLGENWYRVGEEFKEEEDKKYHATAVTSAVFAAVNKFLNDKVTDKGKFCLPFMLRYALRLYDGSLVMHSSPILMTAVDGKFPTVFHVLHGSDGSLDSSSDRGYVFANSDELFVAGFQFDIDYYIKNEILKVLNNWEDIVKSVDIFISAPIYLFNIEGKVKTTESLSGPLNKLFTHSKINWKATKYYTKKRLLYPVKNWVRDGKTIVKLNDEETVVDWQEKDDGYLVDVNRSHFEGKTFDWWLENMSYSFVLPDSLDGKDLYKKAKDISSFYLLKSIKIEDLVADSETIVEVDDEYLQSLVNREVMTDDYDSHDTIIPQFAQAYNARINFANIEKTLYNDYTLGSMIERVDGVTVYTKNTDSSGTIISDQVRDFSNVGETHVFFYIKQNGYEYVTKGIGDKNLVYYTTSVSYNPLYCDYPKRFIFYPNANAYKAVLYSARWEENRWYKQEIELTPSDFLNGAYGYFDPYITNNDETTLPPAYEGELPSASDNLNVDLPNKIYMSDVNNPFHFATTSIYTVGTGTILGISTAAKALSQGQFGQYPLYAFCTDGIWALEISSTGTYSAKQPITRDVCINSDGILQLDNSVIYITDRGIMLIQGSDSTCISDGINAKKNFDLTSLPQFSTLVDLFNADYYDEEHVIDADDINRTRLMSYLAECRMLYDYVHQRVVFYNTASRLAYVYSLKTNLWGHMYINLRSNILSYPEALATDRDGNLVDFSDDFTIVGQPAFLITRPLKIDAPNIHKTVDTILQRGYFRHGHVQQLLYASNDLRNWFLVRSSVDEFLRGFSGTPYKYFRIAVLAHLDEDETIFGSSVQFTPRLNNQPR